jgi:hypothetical protein
MEQLQGRGEFAVPRLATLEVAWEQSLDLRAGRVFADTWDLEKFSVCSDCLESRQKRLHAMNLSQRIFPRVGCQACGGT